MGNSLDFVSYFLDLNADICNQINRDAVADLVEALAELKQRSGRLFLIGVGGSAANCSHAVNDFRKLVGIEAYAPTDNVSELTARTNDEGWDTVFSEYLKVSKLSFNDAILVYSVGGGDRELNISSNICTAIDYAKTMGSTILGIVGRNGGYTAKHADSCVIIPPLVPELITPLSEAWQAVVWHLIVSHPKLQTKKTKWESSVKEKATTIEP